MLRLAVLSACAAVLLLSAPAAPFPFENPDFRQPTGVLAPPEQLAAGDYGSSGVAPRDASRVPRGVGFREADYAVNAATAVQTVFPAQSTEASPAVLAAAAPTRAMNSRQLGDSCTLTDCAGILGTSPSASDADAPPSTPALYESQPAVDPMPNPAGLSVSNNALEHPSENAPGPEVRPKVIKNRAEAKADPVLSQSQQDGQVPTAYSTDATSLPALGEDSDPEAPIAQVNAPLLMVSNTGDPSLPKALHSGSGSSDSSAMHESKIGTVAAGPSHERRGHANAIPRENGRRLRPTRYLSGSSLYPDDLPSPQPINPRQNANGGSGSINKGGEGTILGPNGAVTFAPKDDASANLPTVTGNPSSGST